MENSPHYQVEIQITIKESETPDFSGETTTLEYSRLTHPTDSNFMDVFFQLLQEIKKIFVTLQARNALSKGEEWKQ